MEVPLYIYISVIHSANSLSISPFPLWMARSYLILLFLWLVVFF